MTAQPDAPGPSLPMEIGPATRREPVVPSILAVVAALLLWMSFYTLRITGGREIVVVAVPAGLAAMVLGIALLIWRKSPFFKGRMGLDTHGAALDLAPFLWRKRRRIRLRWSELAALRHTSYRPTSQIIGFELTHQGALAHGYVQPTTRRSPRFLTRRTVQVPAHAFEMSTEALLSAIIGAAEAAGCTVVYRGGEYVVATNRKWELTAAPADPVPQTAAAPPPTIAADTAAATAADTTGPDRQ